MKQTITLLAMMLTTAIIQAQTTNAVVFSEDGDKFTLLLNGEPQNASPQVNVKVTGLTSTYYTAKIDFESSALPDFTSKSFALEIGTEATYVIKKNKKGEFVLRFHSYTPIGAASTATAEPVINPETRRIAEVDDHSTNATPSNKNNATINQTINTPDGNVNTDVVITETTTTTTGAPAKGDKVNIGMNVGGLNMGVNINVTDSGFEQNSNSTVTTTTTTRSSTSTGTINQNTTQQTPRQDVVVASGPCGMKMAPDAFAKAKKSIESQSFAETKMKVAKQATKANCLNVDQIKDIMGLFSFEDDKIEYAKYAYDFCTNPGEYYLINDAFTYSSSVDELNTYLESK